MDKKTNSQVTVSFEMDEDLKKDVEMIMDAIGIPTLEVFFTIFCKAVVRWGGLPCTFLDINQPKKRE